LCVGWCLCSKDGGVGVGVTLDPVSSGDKIGFELLLCKSYYSRHGEAFYNVKFWLSIFLRLWVADMVTAGWLCGASGGNWFTFLDLFFTNVRSA
jgi:hypothetical protein